MDASQVRAWALAALVRALKTGAQALATLIGTGQVGVTELDWPQMLAVAATAMVLSLLTSVAGVPEVDGGKSPVGLDAPSKREG